MTISIHPGPWILKCIKSNNAQVFNCTTLSFHIAQKHSVSLIVTMSSLVWHMGSLWNTLCMKLLCNYEYNWKRPTNNCIIMCSYCLSSKIDTLQVCWFFFKIKYALVSRSHKWFKAVQGTRNDTFLYISLPVIQACITHNQLNMKHVILRWL